MSTNTTPWEIQTLYAGFSRRVAGYMVERIHNPYTTDRSHALLRGKQVGR
jgi:hypothetical protein